MYLHIGENVSIPEKDIIGIFDIDKTTTTGETRSFLSNSEHAGVSITIRIIIMKMTYRYWKDSKL